MKRPMSLPWVPEARTMLVIAVEFRRGHGVEGDPVRMVTAYYDLGGALLAERDEYKEAVATAERQLGQPA